MKNRSNDTKKGSCLGTIIKFLFVVVLIAAVVLVVYFKFFKKPDKEDQLPEKIVTDTEGENPEPEIKFQAKDNEYNILILGYDKKDKLTDVVLVVNIDDNDGALRVMQIPRDTYFNAGEDGEESVSKVNEIFAKRYDHYLDMDEKNDSAGKKALEDTKVLISDGLFINIDYVTLMDVDGFEDIVESIDGVELDITASVTYFDGEKEEEVTVSEGKQTVRGDMVRPIVMLDDVDEITIDRTDMQNRFIKSFVAKLQKTVGIDNLKKLMEIFEIVSKSVVTDMTMDDLLSFMKTMLQYDGTSTVILTMPTQVCGDYFIMNKAATLDIINRYFNTFDKEIPSKYFDQNCRFCDKTDEDAMSIYSAAPDKLSPENGFIPDVAK